MFESFVTNSKKQLEATMTATLQQLPDVNPRHQAALDYSLAAGGKRIRPLLVLATATLFTSDLKAAMIPAMAMEFIHTYSLIHDDLPAMDNDDYRRGRLTSHKQFDEATAILAGDGLLTLAFEQLATAPHLSETARIKLIRLFAYAAGPSGMISGQQSDIEAETRAVSLPELAQIHSQKTGALLQASVCAGAIVGGANMSEYQLLENFATKIGIAFQIQDDILDVIGDATKMGKQTGMDAQLNKSTYTSLLTLAGAQQQLTAYTEAAYALLEQLPYDTAYLEALTAMIAEREA
ncbi:polyprenyl synthetase family protein [Brochothrix campestris]|uniref:Farnesyl diphosphate synthase n=1 Tax=Brochothrix campestris FSL F6-1037 TaxID=1265861 RepID=W7CNG9_9LIST|nr:farnesyl diphosphate synthase [Brochothrix campestris]EUJ38235.1 geranyltranstransferase [Brochothrix campestris FSL F6-1037]